MNIADLPTDIKHYIVDYLSEGFDKSLDGFSTGLQILWISREWRLAALNKIYSCAYLNVNTDVSESQPPLLHKVDTNYTLICRNNLQHLVTSLYIVHTSMLEDMDMAAVVDHVIKMAIYGTSSIKRVNYYTPDCLAQRVADLFTNKKDTIDDSLGAALVREFQNIKHQYVYLNENPYNIHPTHIDTLVTGYGNQLLSVKYRCNNMHLNLSSARKLTNIDLDISNERGQYTLPHITPTNPQYLQTFEVNGFLQIRFSDLFFPNPDSNIIEFNDLRRLNLYGSYEDFDNTLEANRDFESSADVRTHELSFPVLVDLCVRACYISRAELKCLLQAPLKRLAFMRVSSHFLEYYDTLPSTIECLSFNFQPEYDGDLIENLNRIFPRVQGINVVELEMGFSSTPIEMTDINWPNLTHVNMGLSLSIYEIFDFADNAPDLKVLKFIMQDVHDDAIRLLLDIKERYLRPSSSKIHTLTIIYWGKLVNDSFRDALENLKWYWPNLQNIECWEQRY